MSDSFQRSPLVRTFIAAAVLGFLAACGDANKPGDPKPGATEAAVAQDPSLVRVKPEMAPQFKSTPVGWIEMAPVQDVPSRIEANEQAIVRIGASVTGRVTDVKVDVGDRVRRGQTLALVASPELTSAQLSFLRASAAAELAARAEERAGLLFKADVIGSAELQKRQTELSIARAELRAVEDQLRLMGIPEDAVHRLRKEGALHPHALVVATLSGTVVERKVSAGQVAQPGDPLYTVADLSSVWVVAGLPEQAARTVQLGQSVDVEVPALGNKRWSGKIIFVGDTVQPDTRTVTVRTQVANASRDLKPQMMATMRIQGAPQRVLAIPESAVVRENDKDHVYVMEAPLRYRLKPVQLGPANGGFRSVIGGLSEGTQVVHEGAFHLNNERKRAELE